MTELVLTGKGEAATLERAQLLKRYSRGAREPVPREADCCELLGEPLRSSVPGKRACGGRCLG